MPGWRARTAAICTALALAAGAGCTATPGWQQVALPDDFRPASLAAAGDGLLVGGRGAHGPVLLRVTGLTTGTGFALDPNDPEAEVADLIAVSVEGDLVFAIGRWFGGAHSNPRLTLWDGSDSGNRLTSRPQEFWTFGGHDAGNLLGIELIQGRPTIFGLRSAAKGIEGVVWTLAGHTWTKHVDVDPSLVSNPDRVVSFGSLDRLGGRLVVTGDQVGLSGGLDQRPSVWAGAPGGPWTQELLPIPADLPPVSGQLSRATSLACAEEVGCWVAGWVRGRPAVWAVSIGTDGAITVQPPSVLPGAPPTGADPMALVTLVGGRPVVATGAAEPATHLGCPDGWRALSPPTGTVTVLQSAPSGLYVIAGDIVERLDPPRC
ncbi:MAG: hypothetical protein ACOH1Y_06745 [Propionicimonas sp.]